MSTRKARKARSWAVTMDKLPPGWTSRRGLEEAEIEEGTRITEDSRGRVRMEASRARVLHLKVPRALQAMMAPHRAAPGRNAGIRPNRQAVRRHRRRPGVPGGRSPGSTPPNLAKLEAASNLRVFHEALTRRNVEINLAERGAPLDPVKIPLRQVVHWVAVDQMSRADICRRIGLGQGHSRLAEATGRIAVATSDAADILGDAADTPAGQHGLPLHRGMVQTASEPRSLRA
ncbi:hypothetical protein [Mangrovicoccus sp. HB161399]|uniref:hypothetical protein n=1 Tax=Mangrovicoccus sp. HB161399 TaxID=2720392 RepID=UPI00155409F3|nr:hypothetical protein [Mangrovicoccus sp. HB161399]